MRKQQTDANYKKYRLKDNFHVDALHPFSARSSTILSKHQNIVCAETIKLSCLITSNKFISIITPSIILVIWLPEANQDN